MSQRNLSWWNPIKFSDRLKTLSIVDWRDRSEGFQNGNLSNQAGVQGYYPLGLSDRDKSGKDFGVKCDVTHQSCAVTSAGQFFGAVCAPSAV